nr:DUF1178 family protein [Roseibium sp. RKSG952]
MQCEAGTAHRFEAWFRNSTDFDEQKERGLLSCPACGSSQIRKTLMAPAVSTSRKKAEHSEISVEQTAHVSVNTDAAPAPANPGAETVPHSGQAALLPVDVKQKQVVEALRVLKTKLLENSQYVGAKFAEEARKMHYGDEALKPIHGETTPKEAEELLDEGVSVLPLPALPDEKN